MAQWGRNDQSVTANSTTTKETSTGAPIGTYALVKGDQINRAGSANAHFGNTSPGSRAATDVAMFNNTTIGAFMSNVAVGVFGVSAKEAQNTTYSLATSQVTFGGSGYQANATVTLTVTNGGSSGVVNAFANTTAGSTNAGRITALNIQTAGTGYRQPPTLAVAPPAAITIVANTTGIVAATDFLKVTTANSYWQANDRLYYAVAAGNTVIAGLTANTYYYVSFANTTGIVLSATKGGTNVDITDTRTTATAETGHTITGDTARGVLTVSASEYTGLAHAGWVLRKEGTGGRAGRVQYETLVAFGSLGSNTTSGTGVTGNTSTVADATSDNTILPGI